ncbi:MAG TPA: hypothetical protein VFR81_13905, partial [Longimicrobium sp.]|nr:hypothetical protein [Longimicrobium sp.]
PGPDILDIFHWDGAAGQWVARIGGRSFPLPTPAEFAARQYEMQPGLLRLWAVRDEVLDALAGYRLQETLDPAARRRLAALTLYQ